MASIADPAAFWDTEGKRIWWHKPYSTIIDTSHKYLHRWFPDGETNISYNCLDKHVANGDGDVVAFIEDSAYTGVKRKWTYSKVLNRVGRLASIMKEKFNCKKGDTVVIYMPMVIEAAFAMLACARLGVTHSVVFGGFAAKELAERIDDCMPKLIITASCGIEPNKHIKYAPIVDEALGHCEKLENAQNLPRLIKQRTELDGKLYQEGLDESKYFDLDVLMKGC